MREDDEAPEAWTLAELLCMSQGETFIGCWEMRGTCAIIKGEGGGGTEWKKALNFVTPPNGDKAVGL